MSDSVPQRLSAIFALIALLACGLSAQDYYIEDFRFNDQLSDRALLSVFQDSQGFIWTGAALGLNWFDDNTVRNLYSTAEEGVLDFNYVGDIIEGPKGVLWFATVGHGLFKYDYETDTFTSYRHDPEEINSISSNNISHLAISNNQLWVSTDTGIDRLNLVTEQWRHYSVPGHNPENVHSKIRALEIVEQNNLVLVLQNDNLLSLSAESDSRVFTPFSYAGEMLTQNPVNLVKIINNRLYAVVDLDTLVQIDLADYRIREHKIEISAEARSKRLSFNDLIVLDQNSFMLASNHGLFWSKAGGQWKNATFKRGQPGELASNQVNELITDANGLIWLATNDGLQTINPSQGRFRTFNVFLEDPRYTHSKDAVYALLNERNGQDLFTYIEGKGLFKLDVSEGVLERTPADAVYGTSRREFSKTVHMGFSGEKLVVASYTGLYTYDSNTGTIGGPLGDESGRRIQGLRALATLDESTILIGTNFTGGLFVADLREPQPVLKPAARRWPQLNSIRFRGIYDIQVRSETEVWIACFRQVVKFNPQSDELEVFTTFPQPEYSGSDIEAYDLYLAEDGTLWLGTVMGLFSYDDKTGNLLSHKISSDMRFKKVFSITEDRQNRLWMGTVSGLFLYDPVSGASSQFTRNSGLPFEEFNLGSATRLVNGSIAMGGVDGLVVFNPDEFVFKEISPPLVLSEILLRNEPVNAGKHPSLVEELSFDYSNQLISLQYAVLDYDNPAANRIEYRILGSSNDWITQVPNNRVVLNNLQPGQHIIEVRGFNSIGEQVENLHRLTLRVFPPFYQQAWFIGLMLALLITALAFAHMVKTYTLKRHNEKLTSINRSLEEALREKERVSDNLQSSQQRLKNLNDVLNSKIEEIYALNSELKAFNYSLTNVMRVPIRHVVGYAGILRELAADDLPRETRSIIDKIARGIEELNNLLEAISLLSRVKEQPMETHPTDFSKLVGNYVHQYKEETGDEKTRFEIENGLVVQGDLTLLKLVRTSLLDNAVHFTRTREKPVITVQAKTVEGRKYISISDNGEGIDPGIGDKLFEPFYAFHTYGDFSGTGLSLSIVKRIVKRHGGEIHACNQEHGGAEFYFSLGPDDSWLIQE